MKRNKSSHLLTLPCPLHRPLKWKYTSIQITRKKKKRKKKLAGREKTKILRRAHLYKYSQRRDGLESGGIFIRGRNSQS
uniref:Uncharacterized protein n=1 Tax=Anguilla anguilla TaxID=7936 RepID=A0A0E9XT55_ANGAN